MAETRGGMSGLPRPDWQRGDAYLYRGDCREILPTLPDGLVDTIVTDPVWPNSIESMKGSDDPRCLLRDALCASPKIKCIVIHLGCDSDPRFLSAVPNVYPFLRACWLRFARPSYKGRLLNTSEIAYVFGQHPSARVYKVAPGEMVHTRSDAIWLRHTKNGDKSMDYTDRHPCPKQLQMVQWLVKWFGGDVVLDPFMGSGTTGVACMRLDRKFIGIEIESRWFDTACKRIDEAYDEFELFETVPPAKSSQSELFDGERKP